MPKRVKVKADMARRLVLVHVVRRFGHAMNTSPARHRN
jgi:hypothetical protein